VEANYCNNWSIAGVKKANIYSGLHQGLSLQQHCRDESQPSAGSLPRISRQTREEVRLVSGLPVLSPGRVSEDAGGRGREWTVQSD
jgi:hypothetical protein